MHNRTPVVLLTALVTILVLTVPVAAQTEKVCFPSCSEVDGRFLVIATGEALQTLADQPVRLKLAVPKNEDSFEVEIFDGDSGATDPQGNSHWDLLTNPVTYTLYADPNTDGSDLTEIATFSSDEMLDNDWFSIVTPTDPIAAADSGNFFYLLEVTPGDRDLLSVNSMKVRTTGFVLFGLLDQPFAFMATWTRTTSDLPFVYPNYDPTDPLNPANLLGSNYDGTFTFYLDLQLQPGQNTVQEVAMWDGDLDRGDFDGTNSDVDDANTPNDEFPFFDVNNASALEGVAVGTGPSTGAPPDDVDPNSQGGFGMYNSRNPSVQYRVFSPTGDEIALNSNPSGNREWEKFSISTLPFDPAEMDVAAETLAAGTYKIVVEGMDMNNLNAWYFQGNVLCQRQNGEPCSDLPRRYALGDLVWEDLDENGIPNPGEPGVSGVVVNLQAADGTVLARNLTDTAGNYLFDVDPGDYTVEIAAANFGVSTQAGGVGDSVWLDLDADGAQDSDEPGIPNVNVRLVDPGIDGLPATADDRLLDVTQTDERGRYFFSNLPAGNYFTSVDESTLAADLALSGGTDPSPVRTVLSNETFRDLDFGYALADLARAAIGDFLYYDANGDGAQGDGEAGIGGVTVALIAPGDDGIFGTDDDLQASSATTVGGYYLFTDLEPGDYQVEVTDISDVVTDLTLTAAPGTLSVGAGEVNLEGDFGYFSANLHTIADVVWFDTDRNGSLDAGEAGLSSVVVSLVNATGETVLSTTSGADGTFSFAGLPDGQYTLEIDDGANVLAGLIPTTEAALTGEQLVIVAGGDVSGVNFGLVDEGALVGFEATTPSPTQSGSIIDRNVLTFDFGYARPDPKLGSIGDRVWRDENGDGDQGPGEPGIAGVTVELLDDGGNVVSSTPTDGIGSYLFVDLGPGTYTVRVDPSTLPPGFEPTFDRDGDLDHETSVDIDPGADIRDADFGYQPPPLGSIGDSIFEDENGDGVQDPGEPGIPGVTVRLKDENGGVIDTQISDADGLYLFDGLAAGTYTVCVDPTTVPPGFEQTADPDGMLDHETTVDLDAGENELDADFGYQSTGCVPGEFLDEFELIRFDNNDGTLRFASDWIEGDEINGGSGPAAGNIRVVSRGWLALRNKPAYGQPSAARAADLADFATAVLSFDFVLTSRSDPDDLASIEVSTDGGATYVTLEVLTGAADNEPVFGSREYDITAYRSADFRVRFRIADGFDRKGERLYFDNVRIAVDCEEPGSIGDRIWHDLDRDGDQDPGEPGIPGVTVDLKDATGNVIDSQVTDGDGGYLFVDLVAGTYTVCVDSTTLPAGYVQTADPDGVLDNETTVVLEPGQDARDADFGYNAPPLGSICGTVWEDTNADGVQNNGEPGIAGLTMTLKDAAGAVITTVATDGDGHYCFEDLPAGSYIVCAEQPDGLEPTYDPDGMLDNETPVELDPGENQDDVDFGYTPRKDPQCLPNIDFESDSYGTELVAGQVIDDEFAGMTITTMDPANHPAMIFDTANPTGGDLDLGTPNEDFGGPGIGSGGNAGEPGENAVARGKVLIISEDGDSSDPDDNGAGGTITITFDEPVEFSHVGILDIEMGGGSVIAYDATGAVLNSSPIAALGDNSYQVVLAPATGVAKLNIELTSSGGITDLVFCADLCVYNWNGEGGRAFYLPGISTVLAFEPNAGRWQEQLGGAATLTGEVTDQNAPGEWGFLVDVEATGRYVSGDLVYYADWSGTLTGTGEWAGAVLDFEGTGDDFRIGYGGNLKDDDLGLSGWFNWTVLSQPDSGAYLPEAGKGDINADVADCEVIQVCTDELQVRDDFDVDSYGNDDGTDDWAGDWLEFDPEGRGADGGQVRITDGWLRLDDAPDSGSLPSAARTVDLSAFADAGSCELSFHWCTDHGVDPSDTVVLEVSDDGGISYTKVREYSGYDGLVQGHESIDISAWASASTTIRFTVTHKYGADQEHFYIDDLDISCDCS